ncbi:MAG TPA: glycosyltransferase family 2 protein [Caldithrix abyssi]|uniref:Glycosyltransferase family 2 protein n=1 Tax=Caldithrix abyssi TaxID=187145 RepID=A0A7V4TZU4_CALAY|nr:glycosyltransferase family 2 protein [Caldithrix abyssi]
MDNAYRISVIIPHYNGLDILRDCLDALMKNVFDAFETIVIDNGSNDGSQQMVKKNYPEVRLVQNKENRGYAGACNQGIELARAPYVLLLNNDTVMPKNFLQEMLAAMESDETIACVQPKILSIQDKHYFDYSGAAGGEMDILGYPFARGRIFDTVERDKGQYDAMEKTVFWTSGCALLLRKSVTEELGKLDEDFFAHQEEIDLNWRVQIAGYRNVVTCSTYIYHYSGYTLRSDNQRKMYLNHRNNLIMMIKNYSFPVLLVLFPFRVLMEMATVVVDSMFWGGRRGKAVLNALQYIFSHPIKIYKKHRSVQKLRKVSDRAIIQNMYPGSIVIDHFLRKLTPHLSVKKFRKSEFTQ